MKNKITVVLAVLVLSCMFAVAENLGYLDYTAGSTDITTTGDMECTDLTVNGDLQVDGSVEIDGSFDVGDTLVVGLHINNDGTLQNDGNAIFSGNINLEGVAKSLVIEDGGYLRFTDGAETDTAHIRHDGTDLVVTGDAATTYLRLSTINLLLTSGATLNNTYSDSLIITEANIVLNAVTHARDSLYFEGLYSDSISIASNMVTASRSAFSGYVRCPWLFIATGGDTTSVRIGDGYVTIDSAVFRGTDVTGADSFAIWDDGDTARINADNPLKIDTDKLFLPDSTFIGATNLWPYLTAGLGAKLDTTAFNAYVDTASSGIFTVIDSDSAVVIDTSIVPANYSIGRPGTYNDGSQYGTNWGYESNIKSNYATVGGGYSNSASADDATVGGGASNSASAQFATVGGGKGNSASAQGATVSGGQSNIASGDYSAIPGGYNNQAPHGYSFAFGNSAVTTDSFEAMWFSSAYPGRLTIWDELMVERDTLVWFPIQDSSGHTVDTVLEISTPSSINEFPIEKFFSCAELPDTFRAGIDHAEGETLWVYIGVWDGACVLKDSVLVVVEDDGSGGYQYAVVQDCYSVADSTNIFAETSTMLIHAIEISAWLGVPRIDATYIYADSMWLGTDSIGAWSDVVELYTDTTALGALGTWADNNFQPIDNILTDFVAALDSVTTGTDTLFLWDGGKRATILFETP